MAEEKSTTENTVLTQEQKQEIQNDPKKKLVEVSPGEFKVLERMHG